MGNRLLSPTNAGDKSHDESPCKCPDDDANKLPRVEARNKDIQKVRLTLGKNKHLRSQMYSYQLLKLNTMLNISTGKTGRKPRGEFLRETCSIFWKKWQRCMKTVQVARHFNFRSIQAKTCQSAVSPQQQGKPEKFRTAHRDSRSSRYR